MLRPELFEAKRFATLTESAQLLLVKLISLADDEGLVRAEPHYLYGARYAYTSTSFAEIDLRLAELEAARWLRTYRVDGDRYAELIGWRDPRALLYQVINKPSPSRLPEPPPPGAPPENPPEPTDSGSTTVVLPHGSGSGSGSGREGKGSGSDARETLAPAPTESAPSPVDTRPPPPLDLQAALERVRGASERRQLRLGRAAAKRADVQREGYVRRLPTSERCAPDG